MVSTSPSYDHYIYVAHMRRWATENRVLMLGRGMRKPKSLEVGNAVAAERGLNTPWVEAAYGKIEDAFNRAQRRLLDPTGRPNDRDWRAVREYAVLMHDRYPGLRGSAANEQGLLGGNAMMTPDPARWGATHPASGPLANLARTMDREQLKGARLQLLPLNARMLPPVAQVLYAGAMLLGDAGVHAIALHPDSAKERTFVAMPLSPMAMVVFGEVIVRDEEALNLARILNMKIAMESTVVIDTLEAPVITTVTDMWNHQPMATGEGVPKAIHVWSRIDDIPLR